MVLGIVGLGLMGGSFALACREIGMFTQIVGVDHNQAHVKRALERQIIDKAVTFDKLENCDVIVLAIPVRAIIKSLQSLSKLTLNSGTTIIDFGSTKESIIQSTPKKIRPHLVASHPMTGTEFSGPDAAFSSLYKEKIMVICDIENSGNIQQKTAIKLFTLLQMDLKLMAPKEHDRHAAFISHMPHIVSYALANAVLNQEDKNHIVTLAAGGFKSMSRLAKSSPAMWRDIFIENSDNLLNSVTSFRNEMREARKLIKNEEWDKLYHWMKNGKKLYDIM